MVNPEQTSLRRNIRQYRKTLGLTQDDVAKTLGISRLRFHRMETGSGTIRFEMIGRLCTLYGCSIDALVDDPMIAEVYRNLSKAIIGVAR